MHVLQLSTEILHVAIENVTLKEQTGELVYSPNT
jgi:hypothetical protein